MLWRGVLCCEVLCGAVLGSSTYHGIDANASAPLGKTGDLGAAPRCETNPALSWTLRLGWLKSDLQCERTCICPAAEQNGIKPLDRIAVLNNGAKRLRLPLSDITYVLTFALL